MVSAISGLGCNYYGNGTNLPKVPYLPSFGGGNYFNQDWAKRYKDSQKVSFIEGLKAFGKGLIKPITNLVKHPIKSTLMIAGAAALIIGTGGAATPFLIGAGLAMGGFQIAKGGYNAITAKTKAEKLAAWEDVGEGTFTVGASVAGARAYAKANLGGSAVTKNLGALGKDAGIGSKASAIAKGLYSDTVATVKAVPKSVHQTGAMIASGEFTGNLRAASASAKLAIEHRNVAKIRLEKGANSAEYKSALKQYNTNKETFLKNLDKTESAINERYIAKMESSNNIPSEDYIRFLDSRPTVVNNYAQLRNNIGLEHMNILRNNPEVNIAMGIGAQFDISDPQITQATRTYGPAFGVKPTGILNFAA